MKTPNLMTTSGISKSYAKGKISIPVLKGVDLEVPEGKFTAVVGKSGSGKTTLLHLLGTLDSPDSGEIRFEGQRIDNLGEKKKDSFRNTQIGLIFQFYHLLPEFTTLENVLVPRMIKHNILGYWRSKREHTERAKYLLDLVGLSHRLTHKPNQMSGGEMQRAAIARALIMEPRLLLADEPTGNLDSENGDEVMKSLIRLKDVDNLTIVMVTHDDNIAVSSDRLVRLVEGRVEKKAVAA